MVIFDFDKKRKGPIYAVERLDPEQLVQVTFSDYVGSLGEKGHLIGWWKEGSHEAYVVYYTEWMQKIGHGRH